MVYKNSYHLFIYSLLIITKIRNNIKTISWDSSGFHFLIGQNYPHLKMLKFINSRDNNVNLLLQSTHSIIHRWQPIELSDSDKDPRLQQAPTLDFDIYETRSLKADYILFLLRYVLSWSKGGELLFAHRVVFVVSRDFYNLCLICSFVALDFFFLYIFF